MIDEAFRMMQKDPREGCLCEFGVWQGAGLAAIQNLAREFLYPVPKIFGFDSFEGMPVTSVPLNDEQAAPWRPGGYGDTSLEAVQSRLPGVTLTKAVFSDLRPLGSYGIKRVRFARIDCDIYEGYRDSLRLLTPHLDPGSLLLFDEGRAPGDPRSDQSISDSGVRAIREWVQESGWRFKIIREHWTEYLVQLERREV